MNPRSPKPSVAFFRILPLTVLGASLSLSAQEQAPDPYEWVIETYSFPAQELVHGFASEERGALKPPPLPSADAGEEEIREFIKKGSSIVTHFLEMEGLSLPKGALVLFDPESLTLTARLPRIAQKSVAYAAEVYQEGVEIRVELEPLIIEAPANTIREKLQKVSGGADHSQILRELEAMVEQGQAELVHRTRIQSLSGIRSKVEQLRQTSTPVGLALGKNGVVVYEDELFDEGTIWESDPVIGEDDQTVDLSLALQHNYAPSQRIQKPLTSTESRTISVAQTEAYLAQVTSSYAMLPGTARLLGVWKPEYPPENHRRDVLQAAFTRLDLIRVLPRATPVLGQYLDEQGEAVLPIPEGVPEVGKIAEDFPEGMIIRRFLNPASSPVPPRGRKHRGIVDPFAVDPAVETPLPASRTAKEILHSAGIPFPPGSSANYLVHSSTLVVRNTPENVRLVEAYLNPLRGNAMKAVSVTLHIVEGPKALIREAETNTRGLIDHRAEWARLRKQADFSVVTSNWIETRSGRRATIQAARRFAYPVAAHVQGESTDTEGGADKGKDDDSSSGAFLSGTYRTAEIGTLFEVDPVIGDARSIDLNFSLEYHYAPPTITGAAVRAADHDVLDGPSTTFHRAGITTQISTRSGMIRMIGVWEPEGAERFEDAELLQAAFLKAEVVSLTREDEEE